MLDATGEIFAEPKFIFDVSAYVDVSADLYVTTIDLYSKRWRLAGFEYGSGMRFGLRFPIHYEEGQPFNISLDDIQFIVPQISPRDVIKSVLDAS